MALTDEKRLAAQTDLIEKDLSEYSAAYDVGEKSDDHRAVSYLLREYCQSYRDSINNTLKIAAISAVTVAGEEYVPTILDMAAAFGLLVSSGILIQAHISRCKGLRIVEHLRSTHMPRLSMILQDFEEKPELKATVERLKNEIFEELQR